MNNLTDENIEKLIEEGIEKLNSKFDQLSKDAINAALTIAADTTDQRNLSQEDFDDAANLLEEYVGYFSSDEKFGMEMLSQMINIPDWLDMYINYKSYAEDLLEFDYIEQENHYFGRI